MLKPVEIEFLVKDNTRQGLEGVSGGLDGVEKDASAATRRVKELEATIARLKAEAAKASPADSDKYVRQIDALKLKLEQLHATAQKTEILPKSAPQATRTFNGLNMSIQQIARELPSISMGLQTLFLAISNNIPIFADQLAKARQEYQALVAAGQKGTPVWKQVLSSIVSWQTALAVGIMLSVTYGKEIGEWIKGLAGAKKAFDATKKSAEGFHAAMAQGAANAQKELTELKLLYKVATDTTRSYEERTNAIETLQEKYPAYFSKLSNEAIMAGEAADQYKKLGEEILKAAKARAAEGVISENQKQLTLLEATGDAYENYKKAIREAEDAQQRFSKIQEIESGSITSTRGPSSYYTEMSERNKQAKNDLRDTRKAFFKELEKLGEDGKELSKRLKTEYEKSVIQFEEYVKQLNERLLPTAEQIAYDPTSSRQAFKTQQREAEKKAREEAAAARKAAAEERKKQTRENLENRYADALLKQQQEYDELLVEQQQEGSEKELAAIRARHKKRVEEYEKQERELLSLIKRLRAAGKDLGPDAEKAVMTNTALKVTASERVRDRELADAEKQNYDKFLSQYESYLQGLERINRKYDTDLAKLNDSDRKAAAERARKKALEEFTISYAQQFPDFEAWADRIVAMSATKLKELLVKARAELKKLQADPAANQDAVAKAQAKVIKLEKLIPKVEARATDTTRWHELNSILSEVIDTFNEVGAAIGGSTGEVIAAVGAIAGSSLQMANSIKAYREAASIGDTLGKATAFLGAISAGVSILSSLGKALGETEGSLERNIRRAREFNEELRIARMRARIDADDFSNIFGDRLFARYRENIDAARVALEDFEKTKERISLRGSEYNLLELIGGFGKEQLATGVSWKDYLKSLNTPYDSTADSIRNMRVRVRHETAFRSAKYSTLGQLLPELFDGDEVDMDLLTKFVEEGDATFNHLSQENREMLQQMVEDWKVYQEALASMRDYLSSIFGELGNQLTDALVDAFENGTDAAETFKKSVGQALRELAKNMIYSTTLGKVFEDAQKRVEEIYEGSGDSDTKFEQWTSIMQQLITDAIGQQDEFNRMWEEFRRLAEQNGLSIDDPEKTTQQSGKAGAIQTVTQESFARVEGLITSIQIHAANMDTELENSTLTLANALNQLILITENTNSLPLILSLLQMIHRDGLKMK